MDTRSDTSLPKYPLKSGGDYTKDGRAEARPKGNLTVDIYLITPLYTIEGTIFGVDGNNAICIANINFCPLSIVPKSTL